MKRAPCVISSVSHPRERCQMWLRFVCFSLHPTFSTCCSFLCLLWVLYQAVARPRIPLPGRPGPPLAAGSSQSGLLHDQDRKWDTLQRTDGERGPAESMGCRVLTEGGEFCFEGEWSGGIGEGRKMGLRLEIARIPALGQSFKTRVLCTHGLSVVGLGVFGYGTPC